MELTTSNVINEINSIENSNWIHLAQEIWVQILNLLDDTSEKFRLCITCTSLYSRLWFDKAIWNTVSMENCRKTLNDSKLETFLKNHKDHIQFCKKFELKRCPDLKKSQLLLEKYLPSSLKKLNL
jgi:hypothetical protein